MKAEPPSADEADFLLRSDSTRDIRSTPLSKEEIHWQVALRLTNVRPSAPRVAVSVSTPHNATALGEAEEGYAIGLGSGHRPTKGSWAGSVPH